VNRGCLTRHSHRKGGYLLLVIGFFFFFSFFELKGRHANVKAQEAVDHLVSFMLGREEISQLGFEPPISIIHVCTPFHIFLSWTNY
jgi:uncharacterized membrane protein YcaP (DUF421 family)